MDSSGRARALEEVRVGVVERLRARRAEIEEAIFTHVRDGVPDPVGLADAEYVAGLRAAVIAALDYGLTGIELAGELPQPIPSAAIAQARRSARSGVGLDTVLLRYTAGYALLEDFIIQEAENGDFVSEPGALRHVLRAHASVLERLTATIAEEYGREHKRTERLPEQRRAELVQRLLAGESVDIDELGYDFSAWHLGVIATGTGATKAVRSIQARLDCRLLSVSHGEETVWAWLGGPRRLATAGIERLLMANGLAGVSLTVGEPGEGIEGWRMTHRQAQEALLVALRRPERLVRFADVALLAPWLGDPARARSLVETYLSPLDRLRDGGHALRQTLHAYFAAGHNVNATAAALEVDRSTVRRRIRTVEEALGCPLDRRQAELEVAMRLEELHQASNGGAGAPNGLPLSPHATPGLSQTPSANTT